LQTILVQILFGWPAIILTNLLAVAGILLKRPWILVSGGILSVPFSLFINGYPFLFHIPLLLPLTLFGSAWAVHAKKYLLAWLLLIPLAGITSILAVAVLTQFR